jgi:hypothetical protein
MCELLHITGELYCGAARVSRTPRDQFVDDSALEGTGFELSVPREIGLGYEALSFICRHKSPSGPPRAPIPRGEPRPGPMSAGLRRKAVCGSGCAETAKALGLTIPPAVLAMAD